MEKIKEAKSLLVCVGALVLVGLGRLDADAALALIAGAQLLGSPLAEAKALVK